MKDKIRLRNVSSGDLTSYYLDVKNSKLDRGKYTQLGLELSNIKAAINNAVIRPRFRFHILNSDESIKYTLPMEDIVLGGNYTENYQNGQRRSISLSLYNKDGRYTPSINGLWEGTKISFELGLEIFDNVVVWFQKGIYLITNIDVQHTSTDKTVAVTLSDKFAALEGASGTLETSYTIPSGTMIIDVIKDILTRQKGNGEMLDPQSCIYSSKLKDKITQATITREAGSNFGTIILDLANMLSAEVFYDTEGHLNFVPMNDVSNDVDKPILFNFVDNKGDFASNNLSFNLNDIINRVVVIGANVDGEVCDAIAVNADPASPLCYQRIGYRTATPINDSSITSTILAQERANYELRKKLILHASVSNEIRFNPLLLVNNLIGITDNFYGFKDEKFLIQNITCPLDYSGMMTISVTNARNIPFIVGGR